jgi:phenylacetate-coenzyme A ligase PaaK-like adenylate-forming protein
MNARITPLDAWIRHKIASEPALTPGALEAYQLQKLAETLAWVRSRSRFYSQHLRGAPDSPAHLEDLAAFPFTTAQDIRNAGPQFVCMSQSDIQRIVTLQTSGTTGEPKRIYFTAADQELTIDFFDVGMTTLTDPGDRVLILLPGQTPGSVGDLLRLGLLRQERVPLPYGPVHDPLHALETMETQQADCLVGSPTQVLGLARRWQPGHKAPKTILLSTDYAPAAILRELENVWGCRVFDHFGTTEMGLGGGVECEAHLGYHLREADLYFEIVDPVSGRPLPAGQYGEVVFTTLTRRGMPLVRYRTGDWSRFVPGPCPCGTTLRVLERIGGRHANFISIGAETLRLADLDDALFSIPGLLNFSAAVHGSGTDLSLVIEAQMLPLNNAMESTAEQKLRQALEGIPSIRNLKVSARCVQNPNETGSLQKRMILDQRGGYA